MMVITGKLKMKLSDSLGRTINYIRISLTDRCNLNCFYWEPDKLYEKFPKDEILRVEEIIYLISLFYRKFGIKKFRFTGGEPLLRRGLKEIIEGVRKEIGDNAELTITTNGMFLKNFAEFFKEHKVRVNISLDTLNEEKFKKISGFYGLSNIIHNIDYSKNLGLKLKINTVLLRGINDEEISDLIDFSKEKDVKIRFIEFMPISVDVNLWRKHFISESEIIKALQKKRKVKFIGADDIERIYLVDDEIQIGFISTVSHPFCQGCSRIRLSSDGKIYLCLFDPQGYDIKRFIRPKINEDELCKFIYDVVKLKPEGFIKFKREGTLPKMSPIMKQIGG
jgi:cyclic pyranopterin phosphate synthase